MAGDQAAAGGSDALEHLLAAALAPFGVGLYDWERRAGRLVVTLDPPTEGLDLDRVAEVAKAVSDALDANEDLVGEEQYELEVTTPGLERALRTRAHFARASGARVALRLRHPLDGVRRLEGVLADVGDDGIELVAGDGVHAVPFSAIERAHTVFDWKAALAAKRDEPASPTPDAAPVAAGSGHAGMKERR